MQDAYRTLSTCRQVGMDAGAIPWTAIVMYVDRYGLDDFEEELLIATVTLLDKINREAKKQ